MKRVQERTDWVEARKLKRKESDSSIQNIFTGDVKVDVANVEGASIHRVRVSPEKNVEPPLSFALAESSLPQALSQEELEFVEPEASVRSREIFSWKSDKIEDIPLDFKFVQASEDKYKISFGCPKESYCYGLGERLSGLNLKGREHTLFNYSDNLHIPSLDTMYVSIPFLMMKVDKDFYGLFLDSPAWQKWSLDVDLRESASVELLSRRGWTFYLFSSKSAPDLMAAYSALTGRSNLPPDWSLGHHQSRWSYADQDTFLNIAQTIREKKIPCDCVVLDIDYMDEYRVFTHSNERFPDFKETVDKLLDMGIKTTCIVDPGVKKEEKYSVFADGKKRDFFCRRGDGKPFLGKVWPGNSVFPDFLRHDVRVWWAAQHGFFVDNNVYGVWNDMNEPCLIGQECPMPPSSKELPPENKQMFMQLSPEGKVGHFEVRNLYGLQMARSAYEGLIALRPEERPFILSRSGYAGIQRYSAVWLGDNMSWWEHLELSIPMLLNMGLSGVPFCGVDVGGFGDDCTAELLLRWYELGIFYPFFRNHSSMEGIIQEPWVFGEEVEAKIRSLVEFRYRLLPYIKRLFWEHIRNGAPIMRPLFWSFPDDEDAYNIDDQFMFGSDLMVAPVLKRGHKQRVVYFPPGKWVKVDNPKEVIEGGSYKSVSCELGSVPCYARYGSIIPFCHDILSTVEYESSPVTFKCYGDDGIGIYLEDDGTSFEYENQGYNEWLLQCKDGELSFNCANYGYIAPERKYFFEHNGKVKEFKLQGQ